MFWFNSETLKRLSNYPCKMSQEEKVKLQEEWLASFNGVGQPLTFKNDIALIDNNEVTFIQALLYASSNTSKVLNEINNILAENEKKYEEELREKYNPDDIFKNEIMVEKTSKNNELIEYKETFLKKIINKIKGIWHINL